MKTLIFPDLHQPPQHVLAAIEVAIEQQRPDKSVFLGDYFDQFGDTPADAERMALWLAESFKDARRVHLIGNHDASYLWPNDTTYCPGFATEKEAVIRAVLGPDAHTRFQFHEWVDGWLLTHAGLASAWVPEGVDVRPWLDQAAETARQAFAANREHWFIATGTMRGGRDRAGGVLWCDWREQRWPGKQLFGHTPAREVRQATKSVCLDTNIGEGPQHFAVLLDGVLTIHDLRSASRAPWRNRRIVPGYGQLMSCPPGNDIQAALDEIRDDESRSENRS